MTRMAVANKSARRSRTRPRGPALWRGFLCRCPNCGEGALFRAYLKPVDNCAVCGEDMSHQRADDAPPYFTMVIVGHIVVPIMLAVALRDRAVQLDPSDDLAAADGGPDAGLLQPIKGATIALQWALYMHGFDGSDPDTMAEGYLRREIV